MRWSDVKKCGLGPAQVNMVVNDVIIYYLSTAVKKYVCTFERLKVFYPIVNKRDLSVCPWTFFLSQVNFYTT